MDVILVHHKSVDHLLLEYLVVAETARCSTFDPDFGTKTASIIDVQITNPGNGYTYPPFVQIVDSCNQGYGAIARATVKDGRVDKIYLSSVGENYPVEEVFPLTVGRVDILNPGSGYENGDIVSDNLGNVYECKYC